jgi:hypothetical protein
MLKMYIACGYNEHDGTPYSIYLWRCTETSWYSLTKMVQKLITCEKRAATVYSAQSDVKGWQLTKRTW